MNLSELTVDQLKAMGLSDEQIQGIIGVKQATEQGGGLPFPLVKVNYDPDLGNLGDLCFNPQKDDSGATVSCEKMFEQPFKIRFLKSYFQYSKFDGAENRVTVMSNIFASTRDAKKAYDLKSGVPITTIKDNEEDVKLVRISLVELFDDEGNKYYGIFYIRGAYLFAMNEILQKFENEAHLTKVLTIAHEKKKKGRVVYYVPVLEAEEDYDFLKTIKEDSEQIAKFDKWVQQVNSQGTTETTPTTSSEAQDDDIDEDDINF